MPTAQRQYILEVRLLWNTNAKHNARSRKNQQSHKNQGALMGSLLREGDLKGWKRCVLRCRLNVEKVCESRVLL